VRQRPETILAPTVGRGRRAWAHWYSATRTRTWIDTDESGEHWLLVAPQRPHRRTGFLPGDLARAGPAAATGYRRRTTLAGRRASRPARPDRALPAPQVRTWISWHRWTVLVLLWWSLSSPPPGPARPRPTR
jgi:hypothetical protein